MGLAAAAAKDSDSLCNVKLPEPKPLANIDEETAARFEHKQIIFLCTGFFACRCFIVCTPQPPPAGVLRDVFSRFGDLIDVYMLANRNCGYAKYASKKAAEDAIKVV